MPTKNEYSIPTVWSRTNDSVQPSVSNNYNVPHLEEVDHNSLIEEVGAASPANRGKRDVSGFVVGNYTVTIQNPEHLIIKWSFSVQKLCPVFYLSKHHIHL
jgi:hypothetical protein